MRTLRNGCFDTTVAAKSCTDTDAEIRFTSDAKMPMNSTSDPRSSSSSSSFPGGGGGHSSFQSTPSVLGSAVNTTPTPSTIATSSSCEIPASAAASSSSCGGAAGSTQQAAGPVPARPHPSSDAGLALLIENEMVNERSEPRFDNDSDMADGSGARYVKMLEISKIVRSEWIGFEVTARRQPFVVRRLLATPIDKRQPRAVRDARRRPHLTSYRCEAAIFGASFSNLCWVCRNNLVVDPHVFQTTLYETLLPVAQNFRHMTGGDVEHLQRGLGTHRVLRAQYATLFEVNMAPAVQKGDGHGACVIGATAAILILFRVLALDKRNLAPEDGLDTDGLGMELERMLEAVCRALAHWPLHDNAHNAALCAELRALKRAAVAVRLARLFKDPKETDERAMERRLHFYAQAAWPRYGPALNREEHPKMLDEIAAGSVVWDEWIRTDHADPLPVPDDDGSATVVPLSALRVANLSEPGSAGDYRDDASSSVTCTTSPSTVASTNPSSGAEELSVADADIAAAAAQDVCDANEALRVARLAIAAAAAV